MIIPPRYLTVPPSPRVPYRGLTFFGSGRPKTPERELIDLYLSQSPEQLAEDGVLEWSQPTEGVIYPADIAIVLGLDDYYKISFKIWKAITELLRPQNFRTANPKEAFHRARERDAAKIEALKAAGEKFKTNHKAELDAIKQETLEYQMMQATRLQIQLRMNNLVRAYLCRSVEQLEEDGVLERLGPDARVIYPRDILVLLNLVPHNLELINKLVREILTPQGIRTASEYESKKRNEERTPEKIEHLKNRGRNFLAQKETALRDCIEGFCFENQMVSLGKWALADIPDMTDSLQKEYVNQIPLLKVILILKLALGTTTSMFKPGSEIDADWIKQDIPQVLKDALPRVGIHDENWLNEFIDEFLTKKGFTIKPEKSETEEETAEEPPTLKFGGRNPFILG